MNATLCDFCGGKVTNGYSLTPPTVFSNISGPRAHDFCDVRCVQLWLGQREVLPSAGEEEK